MDRSLLPPAPSPETEAFLSSLSDHTPALPDALVTHHLARAGFTTSDERVTRLVGFAAQKFLADVANDAIANSRLRADAAPAPSSRLKAAARDGRLRIGVDDLERALREYGVELRKPQYFADCTTAGAPEKAAEVPQAKAGAAPAANTPKAAAGSTTTPTAAAPAAAPITPVTGVSAQKPPA